MDRDLTNTWAGYTDTAFNDWPRPLRLMARAAKTMWRANKPDAISLMVVLNDLRNSPNFRTGGRIG